MNKNNDATLENSAPVKTGGYQQEKLDEMDGNLKNSHGFWLPPSRCNVIKDALPVSALLDALHHGYILMGVNIDLIIFDEVHHAVGHDPYNRIMREFYHKLPATDLSLTGLTASPVFGGNVDKAFCKPALNFPNTSTRPQRTQHRTSPFSTNLAALEHTSDRLNIENDPYIQPLCNQLSHRAPGTSEYLNLHHPSLDTLDVRIEPVGQMYASDREAPEYTTRLFGSIRSQIPGAVSSLRRCANSISPSPSPPFPRSDQFSLTPSGWTHTSTPVSLLHLTPILKCPLISHTETLYDPLHPLRNRSHRAANSLRSLPFTDQSALSMFHNPLLMLALSALVFQEPTNYQPLETLGDVVLKVVMAARLLGVSVWPEGNLTKRKGHMRLAKESVTSRLYTWLFEFDRLQNKWEPLYIATIASVLTEELSKLSCVTVLADIVDWLIGAVYVHDGLSFSYE
ncbi:hypothetical protein GYMLUDRAFT_251655 [Collybiopsis luxurians FD-317 M1]|uniref:Dicer-like protein 1 n=1 Tax=Collybiopsis luxurians FD-317 M1 TaxID=944289 RepID=A0A0D0C227_9AGAR|nr:hypothetical protein GYMLUDRAFT_251655 [Collybiopsis luxurians FD-317 M1]